MTQFDPTSTSHLSVPVPTTQPTRRARAGSQSSQKSSKTPTSPGPETKAESSTTPAKKAATGLAAWSPPKAGSSGDAPEIAPVRQPSIELVRRGGNPTLQELEFENFLLKVSVGAVAAGTPHPDPAKQDEPHPGDVRVFRLVLEANGYDAANRIKIDKADFWDLIRQALVGAPAVYLPSFGLGGALSTHIGNFTKKLVEESHWDQARADALGTFLRAVIPGVMATVMALQMARVMKRGFSPVAPRPRQPWRPLELEPGHALLRAQENVPTWMRPFKASPQASEHTFAKAWGHHDTSARDSILNHPFYAFAVAYGIGIPAAMLAGLSPQKIAWAHLCLGLLAAVWRAYGTFKATQATRSPQRQFLNAQNHALTLKNLKELDSWSEDIKNNAWPAITDFVTHVPENLWNATKPKALAQSLAQTLSLVPTGAAAQKSVFAPTPLDSANWVHLSNGLLIPVWNTREEIQGGIEFLGGSIGGGVEALFGRTEAAAAVEEVEQPADPSDVAAALSGLGGGSSRAASEIDNISHRSADQRSNVGEQESQGEV